MKKIYFESLIIIKKIFYFRIPPQNGILGLGQDSNYKNQNNEAQLSSANGAENFGKPVDNSVYNSGSQPGYSLGGLPKLVQVLAKIHFHV